LNAVYLATYANTQSKGLRRLLSGVNTQFESTNAAGLHISSCRGNGLLIHVSPASDWPSLRSTLIMQVSRSLSTRPRTGKTYPLRVYSLSTSDCWSGQRSSMSSLYPLQGAIETARIIRLQTIILDICLKSGEARRLSREAPLVPASAEGSNKRKPDNEAIATCACFTTCENPGCYRSSTLPKLDWRTVNGRKVGNSLCLGD
jgi:hypothetical protein